MTTIDFPAPRAGGRARRGSVRWLWIVAMLVCASGAVRGQVIDRIVAVVGGQAITWSDVRAARALQLVSLPGPTFAAATRDLDIVDGLIARELMRAEVDRFSIAPPDAAEVETRVAAARARLGGADATAALDALGLSDARLRAWIEDDRRIERYLAQRFDVAAQPTDEEVVTFFQSREREFVRDGQPQPFAAAQAEARTRLVGERRRQLIDEWVAGLRRRTAVTLIPAA
jgi:hypothetical protein